MAGDDEQRPPLFFFSFCNAGNGRGRWRRETEEGEKDKEVECNFLVTSSMIKNNLKRVAMYCDGGIMWVGYGPQS